MAYLFYLLIFDIAVQYLQQQGAETANIEIAEMEEMRISHLIAIITEFSTGMKADLAEHPFGLVMCQLFYDFVFVFLRWRLFV